MSPEAKNTQMKTNFREAKMPSFLMQLGR